MFIIAMLLVPKVSFMLGKSRVVEKFRSTGGGDECAIPIVEDLGNVGGRYGTTI